MSKNFIISNSQFGRSIYCFYAYMKEWILFHALAIIGAVVIGADTTSAVFSASIASKPLMSVKPTETQCKTETNVAVFSEDVGKPQLMLRLRTRRLSGQLQGVFSPEPWTRTYSGFPRYKIETQHDTVSLRLLSPIFSNVWKLPILRGFQHNMKAQLIFSEVT